MIGVKADCFHSRISVRMAATNHHPFGGILLLVSQIAHGAMRLHAEAAYLRECCGALVGHRRGARFHIALALPATSPLTVSEPDRYAIAPAELVRFQARAAAKGMEILGFYHSHPDHPALWSPADLDQAHWIDSIYLILAVEAGQCREMRAFLLAADGRENKSFQPVAMEVPGAASVFPLVPVVQVVPVVPVVPLVQVDPCL